MSEFVFLNLCYSKDPTNGELWSVCDLIVRSGAVYIAKVARRRLALHNEHLIVPLYIWYHILLILRRQSDRVLGFQLQLA